MQPLAAAPEAPITAVQESAHIWSVTDQVQCNQLGNLTWECAWCKKQMQLQEPCIGIERVPGPLADIGRAPAEEPALVLIEASGVSSVGAPGAISGGGGGIASSSSSTSSTSSTRVSAAAPEGHDAASITFLGWTQAYLNMLPGPASFCELCAARAMCAATPHTVVPVGSLDAQVSVKVKATDRPV